MNPIDSQNKNGEVDSDGFQYDVAFSFVADDEATANALNDRIKSRCRTFIYHEHQERLAGIDGERVFAEVFGKEARLVVVLHRAKWGQTGFTRIEEIAIKNRAFEEGYDFTLFIPLDGPGAMPRYLPKTQIWYALDRFGIDAAAEVIASKIRETGGRVRKPTAIDLAGRIDGQLAFDEDYAKLVMSEQGVRHFQASLGDAVKIAEERCSTINATSRLFKVAFNRVPNGANIRSYRFFVLIEMQQAFINTLSDAHIHIRLGEHPPLGSGQQGAQVVGEEKWVLTINRAREYRWKPMEKPGPFLDTAELIDRSIGLLIERLEETKPWIHG